MRPSRFILATAITAFLCSSLAAQEGGDGAPSGKAPRNDTPEAALKSLSVAPGYQVDVWAAEPLFANPVALSFDEKGRAFVAETYRRRTSTPDIRKHMDWLIPDLALRTVAEREAFLKKTYPIEGARKADKEFADQNGDGQFDWRDWAIESERVRLVEDRDHDGKAETSSTFLQAPGRLESGVGAGVLAHEGEVWYTAIPDLWHAREAEGKAANPEALLSGFGVHVAYGGHDMHGIKLGPDGKIYWTIADCGVHVTTREGKVIDAPDMGAVFRANPDGSEMELYAFGLRNPQSLAFNEVGDLFTGDNNADGGDRARWEHVVEGGDYGWRIGWQFQPKLGLWNTEKLWELDRGQTALSLLPSVGHIGHGPAGIAYYPGTGLTAQYRDHFFYADFPGGVRSFALKPKGASYTVDNPGEVLLDNTPKQMSGKILWGLFPSDVAFGVDGGLYVLDWVQGWEKTGKGRIFRVHAPEIDQSDEVKETRKLLGEGMHARPEQALIELLGYPDQRVRLGAQWELAARGPKSSVGLVGVALSGAKLAPLHAVWALGQIARKQPAALVGAAKQLLASTDPEVRAQTAKVLGEAHLKEFTPDLIQLLQAPEPRVQFFAALALGKVAAKDATPALLELLRRNADKDAFVRHAAVISLVACGDQAALTAAAKDPADAVRAGVLLALRRLHSPAVAGFLADQNPQLALEAARAIHDEPVPEALPALAALAGSQSLPDSIHRRAINANYRLGTAAAAQRLAGIAGDQGLAEPVRLDALAALTAWNEDLGRDRLLGIYRPLPTGRDAQGAVAAAVQVLPALLEHGTAGVQLAAAEMATSLKLRDAETLLVAAAGNPRLSARTRATILGALAAIESPKLGAALAAALTDKDPVVLEEARRLSAKLSPNNAVAQSAAALESGSVREKQSALHTLATLPPGAADRVLGEWLDRMAAGKVLPALQLDLLEAAAVRTDGAVQQKLAAVNANRDGADPLSRWRECLEGGDAKAGREIFNEKAEAACMRCHKVAGVGGDVGPDLAGLGTRHDRAYILTSIVSPNAAIAPGYETALFTLKDGAMVVGIVSAEDADGFTITPLAGGEKTKVKKDAIKQRDKVPSPMPEGLGEVLGKRDLRNVVEFLAELK